MGTADQLTLLRLFSSDILTFCRCVITSFEEGLPDCLSIGLLHCFASSKPHGSKRIASATASVGKMIVVDSSWKKAENDCKVSICPAHGRQNDEVE